MKKPYDTLSGIELVKVDPPYRYHYLELYRVHLRNHYPDGKISKAYTYETVVRRNLDAVAVLLFEDAKDGPRVYLRRTLRPSLLVRDHRPTLTPGEKPEKTLLSWREPPILLEIVAGILEAGETTAAALKDRAVAEVWEETGLRVSTDQLIELGHWFYPTPGMNPEAIHLFAAPIDPAAALPPPGDGSPIEDVGGLVGFTLSEAVAACTAGQIRDAKSEIALHRFSRRKV